ncbi:hypothetical protein Tco_0981751, partial [Tanacetum coccineum]
MYKIANIPLFSSMIIAPETSPSRITSSPSLSPKHTPEKSDDTELIEEPTELVEDQGSGEKGEQEVTTNATALNTASVPISTVTTTPEVSIAAANLKSKKQLKQERLSHEEAIRLQEQIDEEERKRIARDAEIA